MKKIIITLAALIISVGSATAQVNKECLVLNQSGLVFEANVALSSLIAITDGHIKSIAEKLALAAATAEAQSGDWRKIKPLLTLIQKDEGDESTVWFARPDGSYYSVDLGLTDKNLKDRSYFPDLMAGKATVGHLVISKSTSEVSAIIAVPIKKDGRVKGALGLSLFTKKLSVQIKNQMGLDDNVVFYALNKDYITVINFKPERVFLNPEKQDSSSMAKAMEEMISREQGIIEYDFHGVRRVAFRRSAYTGWWYAIGLPVKK